MSTPSQQPWSEAPASSTETTPSPSTHTTSSILRVLNVGCGPATTKLPARYDGWEEVRLDIDPYVQPDWLIDATKLKWWVRELGQFSAVYCSHNLEHYYDPDAAEVVQGMYDVLAPGGHVMLLMPDVKAAAVAIANGADLYDLVPGCTFTWHQCLYGSTLDIVRSGTFWAHKTGFTEDSLRKLLLSVGFVNPMFEHGAFELAAMAFKPKEG